MDATSIRDILVEFSNKHPRGTFSSPTSAIIPHEPCGRCSEFEETIRRVPVSVLDDEQVAFVDFAYIAPEAARHCLPAFLGHAAASDDDSRIEFLEAAIRFLCPMTLKTWDSDIEPVWWPNDERWEEYFEPLELGEKRCTALWLQKVLWGDISTQLDACDVKVWKALFKRHWLKFILL